MTKTYRSDSSISVNVVLPSGQGMHIAFLTHSNGSSTYITSDPDVQKGLEGHYRFGELFRVESVDDGSTPAVPEASAERKPDNVVRVADMGEAKDYLADSLGISRTLLRSQKNILDQAAAHGIGFDFGDKQ